jgi:hypothetical protein
MIDGANDFIERSKLATRTHAETWLALSAG